MDKKNNLYAQKIVVEAIHGKEIWQHIWNLNVVLIQNSNAHIVINYSSRGVV